MDGTNKLHIKVYCYQDRGLHRQTKCQRALAVADTSGYLLALQQSTVSQVAEKMLRELYGSNQ